MELRIAVPLFTLRLTGLACVALVTVSVFGCVAAQAAPISYTISAVGSGSLGTNSFSDVSFTITSTADTSQIDINSPLFPDILVVTNESATIEISGLGTATFTSTLSDFANQYVGPQWNRTVGAVGVTDISDGYDIIDVQNSAFDTYDLRSSIGPVSGTTFGNAGYPVGTTAGTFQLNSLPTTATFQATLQSVPEPATVLLVALGLGVLLIGRRRSS
jgi:PEP-CTERM motif-containing protein